MPERSHFALNSQWLRTHLHGLWRLTNWKPAGETGGDESLGMRATSVCPWAVSWFPWAAVTKYNKLVT